MERTAHGGVWMLICFPIRKFHSFSFSVYCRLGMRTLQVNQLSATFNQRALRRKRTKKKETDRQRLRWREEDMWWRRKACSFCISLHSSNSMVRRVSTDTRFSRRDFLNKKTNFSMSPKLLNSMSHFLSILREVWKTCWMSQLNSGKQN